MATPRDDGRKPGPGSPAPGIAMLLGGAALLVVDWIRNGFPEGCRGLDEACWRALTEGGLLAWSGLLLATVGSIHLVSFAIWMLAVAFGVGRSR